MPEVREVLGNEGRRASLLGNVARGEEIDVRTPLHEELCKAGCIAEANSRL